MGPDGLHRYMQNIPSQSNRVHILLYCTGNVLQNISHTGSQIRSQTVPKDGGHSLHIFRLQCFENGTRSEEESWKELKYMEAKEHSTKERMSQPEIIEEFKNFLEKNENENKTIQNL